MNSRAAFRRWAIALGICATATAICIQYVDRPATEFFEAHLRHTPWWTWIDRALRPLDVVVVIAPLFLIGCGIWTIADRRLGPWSETPLLCAWSAVLAIATTVISKHIFGRGWPDPTYLRDHFYGFHFFLGGLHWDSFPSGTALISSAIVSVLWMMHPRWRAVSALVVALLLVAVVVTNYHWVSDVIAGSFLGASIGWSTVRLWKRGLDSPADQHG